MVWKGKRMHRPAWCRVMLIAGLLLTAQLVRAAAPAGHAPMGKPGDHAVLKMWRGTTSAPGYAKASAHEPRYDDAALWPAELRMDGTPAYMQQKWEPARVLLWNRRDADEKMGGQVNLMDPANWLEDGKPAKRPPDYDADVVFPDSDQRYFVLNSQGNRHQSSIKCRHITVGRNARVSVFGCDPKGNWWIKKGGSIYERHGGRFSGGGHAFARNDNVPAYRPGLGVVRPAEWSEKDAPLLQEISQYIHIAKPDGSLEAVGNWGTQDQFHVDAGTFIIGPLSAVGTGSRASLVVHGEGVLQLQSGSAISKSINQTFNYDAIIEGTLRAGSPERPIRQDAVFGLSAKDYVGEIDDLRNYRDRLGLKVKGDGQIEVHRAPDSTARLVLQWHGIDLSVLRETPPARNDREDSDRRRAMQGAAHFPRTITLDLPARLRLQHVAFDNVRLGGIRGVSAEQVAGWRDIEWRSGNQGPVEYLIAPTDWYANVVARQGWPTVQIPPGTPLTLELRTPLIGVQVHFTLDGSQPSPKSAQVAGPVTIERTTTVLARAFAGDRPQGSMLSIDCLSEDVALPAVSGGSTPGLRYRAGGWYVPEGQEEGALGGKSKDDPPATGVVPQLAAQPADVHGADGNRAVELEGFLSVPSDGVYEFALSADAPARAELLIDGIRVISIDDRSEGGACRVALQAGAHAVRFLHRRAWWGSSKGSLQWRGPGMGELIEVPASAWSHQP